jgi:hypothetical protein
MWRGNLAHDYLTCCQAQNRTTNPAAVKIQMDLLYVRFGSLADIQRVDLADILRVGIDVRQVPKADMLASAMPLASPLAQDLKRSGRGLQGLGRNIPAATLAA